MKREKLMFCGECGEQMTHKFIEKKGLLSKTGITRVAIGIVTAGLSETLLADRYWECKVCGKVRKT